MEVIKRTACYIRVSTEEQVRHGLSLSAQKDKLKEYANKNNLKVIDFYIDEGITARKNLKNRLEFQRMLKDIQSNKIDLVIFIKLDRFFRNVSDYYKTMEIFDKHNVAWKATEEEYDTTTSAGRLNLNIRLSIAQNESDQTSDRINFVFKNKREKGEVTSGTKIFGYDIINKHYVKNEKEAKILEDIYNYFINTNGSFQDTFDYFIHNYYPIGYDAFKKYLSNTAYIGKYKRYRKDEYIENYTPVIVDPDLFKKVQIYIDKRKIKSKHSHEKSLFDGIVFCNSCKHKLTKAVRTSKSSYSISYHCWRSSKLSKNLNQKYVCLNRTHLAESKIEKYLLSNIKNIAKNKILSYNLKRKNIIQTKVIDNSKDIKTKLDKLKDLYLDNLIDKDTYKIDYEKYNKQLNEIENRLKIQKPIDNSANLEKVKKILNLDIENIYQSLNKDEKRKFWIELIDKIFIENGEIKEVILQ